MKIELKRTVSLPSGTYGLLLVDGLVHSLTLEPPEPIIPPGTHHCHRSWFNKDSYEVFEVEVPGHSHVYFHIGNSAKDTDGCVLLGMMIWNGHGLGWSKPAFNSFMERLEGVQEFDVEVFGD